MPKQRTDEPATLFFCTADNPWTMAKVCRGGNQVVPSRHPDAVLEDYEADGPAVYRCPHCHCDFTDTSILGPADERLVQEGMKVVHRLMLEQLPQSAYDLIARAMVSTTPNGDYVLERAKLEQLLDNLRFHGAK